MVTHWDFKFCLEGWCKCNETFYLEGNNAKTACNLYNLLKKTIVCWEWLSLSFTLSALFKKPVLVGTLFNLVSRKFPSLLSQFDSVQPTPTLLVQFSIVQSNPGICHQPRKISVHSSVSGLMRSPRTPDYLFWNVRRAFWIFFAFMNPYKHRLVMTKFRL